MRREMITWSVVFAIVIAAFAGTVLILNATLYSASGFVRGYLDSLARHDADGALELAGTAVVGDASDELLKSSAMSDLTDIRLVSETTGLDGVQSVVFEYSADGVQGQSTFDVRQSGALFGLFPTWSFTASPLGVIQLTVRNDSDFTANGIDLTAPQPNQPSPYLVFTPGTYEISHSSMFLTGPPIKVATTEPGGVVEAALEIEANEAFVEQVQKEIDDYLDECATQTVLLPTGCPFGQSIGNRIVNTPQWSIAEYPAVSLVPGPEAGSWLMPPVNARAHLVVDVRSLFDGTVSTFDSDVPFTSSYLVTFLSNNELLITAQYE
ncbi:MAG: hypothetical protein JWP85_1566 [Rhodoglobus sp.]|nr:hypothetical protein [Rhodoglobus sp.]